MKKSEYAAQLEEILETNKELLNRISAHVKTEAALRERIAELEAQLPKQRK
uniref:Uncharacterized protein n=1 Tax=Pseudomonas phage RVTF4 TaxID=3236931 RepID=A0AB39CDD5_9VIRU